MDHDSHELKIHHIQIKLNEEEYDMLDEIAHVERVKITPFARALFLAALKKEQTRLGLIHSSRRQRRA